MTGMAYIRRERKGRQKHRCFLRRGRLMLALLGVICLFAGCAAQGQGDKAGTPEESLQESQGTEESEGIRQKGQEPEESEGARQESRDAEGTEGARQESQGTEIPEGSLQENREPEESEGSLQESREPGASEEPPQRERKLHIEVSLDSECPEAPIYEAFLQGECEAALSGTYYSATSYWEPVPAGRQSFCFQDMLDTVVSGIWEDRGIDGVARVECALIDCGSDGRPELAVRVYGVSIYEPYDSSHVITVFRCLDGRVELVYSVDCWARSDTEVYPDGYVAGGGSGGAQSHSVERGMIGADGVYREYEMDIETGQKLYGMAYYKPVRDEELPAEFYECTLGDEKIYGYYILEDIPEDVRANVMEYIAENERIMGVKFLPSEEMDRQLDVWADSLGITEEMLDRWETGGISWETLEGCEDYLWQREG